MNIKLVVSTAVCAVLFAGAAAADQATDQVERNPVVGFGSGTGMGAGGGAGSATSLADGFNSQTSGSGGGSQTFGAGFSQQQTSGSGPLSYNPSTNTGSSMGTGAPTLTNPYKAP